MKLAIMQPYFLPYIGYWQLIKAVDTYIVYDDVNYIKSGWINRNNFLVNKDKQLFTIQIKGASSYKLINQIEIIDDFVNFIKSIHQNYNKSPFFGHVMKLLKQIAEYNKSNLALFIFNSIKIIINYLHIDVNLVLSSSLNKNNVLKGKEKVIDICKTLGVTDYYNAIGGIELYSKQDFIQNGINLFFLKTNITPYKQLNNKFVPNLSILDVMMFNSVEKINQMLDDFELL